eukprot:TRINITY_DN15962_c0_g1_i1.p1 TRINITY_DN15962_c0_g1~~TRINITY_DN15962_c0_g1_i1.p1  ORF type:complete len:453 (-),score=108.50 TRINITY_DN15962_c0_g1_i1:10-1368(-)
METDDFNFIKQRAFDGDDKYQILYAYRLFYGYGCIVNIVEAKIYCEKSSEQGNLLALAFKYYMGWGVEKKNFYKTFDLLSQMYEKDKEIKNVDTITAVNFIGFLYMNGEGIQKNIEKAIYYLNISASMGNAHSNTNLGWIYEEGEYVPRDVDKSIELYKDSILQYDSVAMNNLGLIYETLGDFEQALKYYNMSVNQNYPTALYNMGCLYDSGSCGVEIDTKIAFEHFQKAANLGEASAISNLAIYYQNGIAVEKNMEKALEYYHQAAELDLEYAVITLASMYFEGELIEKNMEKATTLFLSASKFDSSVAYSWLSRIESEKKDVNYHLLSEYLYKSILFEEDIKESRIEKDQLKNLINTKVINWNKNYHIYFPFKFDLVNKILTTLLCVSKFRKESSHKYLHNVIVTGISMNIISFLCNFLQNDDKYYHFEEEIIDEEAVDEEEQVDNDDNN